MIKEFKFNKKRDEELNINENDIHIWYFYMRYKEEDINFAIRNLKDYEINECFKYVYNEDRARAIFGKYMLRDLLSRYLKCNKNKIIFIRDSYGKLHLSKQFDSYKISFNLSHSGDYIVACFSLFNYIGIDIEKIRMIPEIDMIAKNNFNKNDKFNSKNSNIEDKIISFYKIWVSKEAYVKALGCGLNRELNTFYFTCSKGDVFVHDNIKGIFKCKKINFTLSNKVVGTVIAI